jgi:predicted lipid-binding transport protein (Tim44 family)
LQISEIFDLTNILLLAVAVLIFFRLRSVLGRRTGNERPRLDPYAAPDGGSPRDRNNVVTLPRAQDRTPGAEAPAASVDDRLGQISDGDRALEPLRQIAAADPSFEVPSFLNGAKAAYEMIVTAYAHGDRETLHNLLSPEVYDSFNAVISERESRSETTEFSIVGISSAGIVDAQLIERAAHVTVRFVSELVTAVRNKAGEVVEGDLKAVRQVTDIWTFARDVNSPDPNWRLVATDTPEG